MQVQKQQEQFNRTQDPRDKKYLDALIGQLERAKQERKIKKAQVTPVDKFEAGLARAREEQRKAEEKLGDARIWLTGLEEKLQEETSSAQATPAAVEKLRERVQLATEKATIREGVLRDSAARLERLEQGAQQFQARAQRRREAAEQAQTEAQQLPEAAEQAQRETAAVEQAQTEAQQQPEAAEQAKGQIDAAENDKAQQIEADRQ